MGAQVLQEGAVNATAEMPLHLHDTDTPISAIIGERQETAALSFFDGHLGYNGDAGSGRDHRENGSELPAFENDVGAQVRPSTCGQGVVPKTVTFLQQQERIMFDLGEIDTGR